jgi:hypothetical protein
MTEGAAADHPIHAAAEGGRFDRVRALLDAEPGVTRDDLPDIVEFLRARGAD